MAERGRRHTARDYTEALSGMDNFASLMGAFSQDYDAIVTPTMPILPFDAGERRPEGFDVINWYELEYFLYPFSLSGQPAISVPCSLSLSRLPIGMQIVGRRMGDVSLMSVVGAFQSLIPAPTLRSLPLKAF
jgi:aspartyl-tRNA(Asn)/glutamyl-tRNA(Gln) amidotransferase subunit A